MSRWVTGVALGLMGGMALSAWLGAEAIVAGLLLNVAALIGLSLFPDRRNIALGCVSCLALWSGLFLYAQHDTKTGAVTADVAKAVSEIKGGKIEFRIDRNANLHFVIGKASFSEVALVENYAAALDEILRLKPSASKGRYIRK